MGTMAMLFISVINFRLETTRHSKPLDKWGLLLGGDRDAIVRHPFGGPNGTLQVF